MHREPDRIDHRYNGSDRAIRDRLLCHGMGSVRKKAAPEGAARFSEPEKLQEVLVSTAAAAQVT
jgi:hypothetical protein